MIKTKRLRIYILSSVVVLFLVLQFASTGMKAFQFDGISGEITSRIVRQYQLPEFISGVHSIYLVNFLIRKAAHFLEFFLLAFFVYAVVTLKEMKKKRALALTFVFCLLAAAFDEFHQIFVSGRSPELTDVMIDSIGAAAAILIIYLVRTIYEKRRKT